MEDKNNKTADKGRASTTCSALKFTHDYIAETLGSIAVPVEDYLLDLESQAKELIGTRGGNLTEKVILTTRERLERVRELERYFSQNDPVELPPNDGSESNSGAVGG